MNFVEFGRNGQKVWPFCTDCGCRLHIDWKPYRTSAFITHFGFTEERDGAGHPCPSLRRMHITEFNTVKAFV